MKKQVEQVFILKDISRTASLVIGGASDNIAEGEGVVLDKNKAIMSAGATYTDSDTIYIVEGLGSTYDYITESGTSVTSVRQLLYSNPIKGADITEWSGVSYTAPAQEVWTVDLTGWVPVSGTEYRIKIVYKDLETIPRQFSKTYPYTATSATLDTEGAGIAALINADTRRRVDAAYATSTNKLTLTGKAYDDDDEITDIDEYKQVNFEVFLVSDNFDTYTSSAATTVPTQGVGYYKQVRDEERWSQGYEGQTNRIGFPVIGPTVRTVKSETYDTLVIRHKNTYTSVSNWDKNVDITTKIFIPNPASANQATDILAVLNPWMASVPGAFTNVSV